MAKGSLRKIRCRMSRGEGASLFRRYPHLDQRDAAMQLLHRVERNEALLSLAEEELVCRLALAGVIGEPLSADELAQASLIIAKSGEVAKPRGDPEASAPGENTASQVARELRKARLGPQPIWSTWARRIGTSAAAVVLGAVSTWHPGSNKHATANVAVIRHDLTLLMPLDCHATHPAAYHRRFLCATFDAGKSR